MPCDGPPRWLLPDDMRWTRLDGRFPTARYAEPVARHAMTSLDGRSPTARYAVFTARSLRPRLISSHAWRLAPLDLRSTAGQRIVI